MDVRPQQVGVFGLVDAPEKTLAPTFKSCQDGVAGVQRASSDQQILEWGIAAGVEHSLQLVEHVMG